MSFPIHLYLSSALGAAITTALVLPLWRAWCLRIGLVDDPGPRKIHAHPVPLAGGLAIMTGLVFPIILLAVGLQLGSWSGATIDKISYGFNRRAWQLGAILLGAAGMLLLGWLDDKHELRPGWKFSGQVVIASLVAAAGVRITLFVPNPIFSYFVTILWILTVTNAFNFMDNMNGLCAGLAAIASLLLGFTAALQGQYLVASLAFLIFGAVIGFLPYNFPRATAFLGDAGSHLLGYLLAVLSILPHFYSVHNPHSWAVLSPLFILALPLGDLVWVVVLRWRLGQPFYVGDNNHLSHRLVRRGISPTGAVIFIWLVAAFLGSLALLWN